jgi:hypothetical protein
VCGQEAAEFPPADLRFDRLRLSWFVRVQR